MTTTTLKLHFAEDNIRRITLHSETTFEEFTQLLNEQYAEFVGDGYQLKYVDTDGDFINVDTQLEWAEMITESSVAVHVVGLERTEDFVHEEFEDHSVYYPTWSDNGATEGGCPRSRCLGQDGNVAPVIGNVGCVIRSSWLFKLFLVLFVAPFLLRTFCCFFPLILLGVFFVNFPRIKQCIRRKVNQIKVHCRERCEERSRANEVVMRYRDEVREAFEEVVAQRKQRENDSIENEYQKTLSSLGITISTSELRTLRDRYNNDITAVVNHLLDQ